MDNYCDHAQSQRMNQDKPCSSHEDQPQSQEVTSSEAGGSRSSSPPKQQDKADSSTQQQENRCHGTTRDSSIPALETIPQPQKENDTQQEGEPVQYFQANGEFQHHQLQQQGFHPGNGASEFAAASTLRQINEDNRTGDEPTEEGLLGFEDSNGYGEEIARWMEDQRRLQQQLGQATQHGTDDSSIVLPDANSNGVDGTGDKNDTNGIGISPEKTLKRPSSAMSNSSSSQKALLAKRRQRSQSASQAIPGVDTRSASRKRMDAALYERTQSQLLLREALLALQKANAVVSDCRSRYNTAKDLVENTAREECNSLLQEDSPWNEMFQKLKQYRTENGDCNVKQHFGGTVEENKNAPELVRKLSAWVGKNRKDGKLRGGRTTSVCGVNSNGTTSSRARQKSINEESDMENMPSLPDPPTDVLAVKPDETLDTSPPPAGDNTATESRENEDHGDDGSVFEDAESDSIRADPYKQIALDSISFDWDPRNSRWNNMFEELKRYKEENGNTLVPHANHGLGAWVKRQQVQYTLFSKGKSDLTEERVRLLNDLGFVWSRRSNTWNENFQRLSKWKETHGTCHFHDDSKDPELATLHKWVADQRVHYKRQVADEEENCGDNPTATDSKDCPDKSSGSDGNNATKKRSKRKLPKLSQDKIAKLQSIGFEFDSRDAKNQVDVLHYAKSVAIHFHFAKNFLSLPSPFLTELATIPGINFWLPKWLKKLNVLLKYKQQTGDFLVPSSYPEDPTLSNWVASQRAQYKLHLRGSKSHMTERRLKILTDAGFPFSVNEVRQQVKKEAAYQDQVSFDAKPWLEKYKDFLFYIASHGNKGFESLQKSNPILAAWVSKQGGVSPPPDTAPAVKEKDEETMNNLEAKEQESLMEAAHYFLLCQNNKAKSGKDIESSTLSKDEPSSWDDQFGNIAAWYIKHGSFAPKGMPSRMKKFVSKQQEQYRHFTSGLQSELTSERVLKLDDICFPFDKTISKDSRDDDATTIPRRNRSWEEYRLDLAMNYVRKGTYDSNSLDDVDLRRWTIEQKRQHKLYLAGKQTTLSLDQIQKLVDIKLVAKRPKPGVKSWPEFCCDLVVFRIHFGTFDVTRAHVVSKGRLANQCTHSNALKSLQEWVLKLRGHYCESSKTVSTNEDLSQEQKAKLDTVEFPWTGSWSTNEEAFAMVSFPPEEHLETNASMTHLKSSLFGMTLEMQHL